MSVSTSAACSTVWSKEYFMCSRYYFDSDTMRDILDIVEETDTELRELQINKIGRAHV